MTTPYHAKYLAYELTKKTVGDNVARLSRSLFDAKVDLNPHQIEAALFALCSPISSGVLLADGVGLGKTIEAGIVLCQYWAERKRKLIIICRASIRKLLLIAVASSTIHGAGFIQQAAAERVLNIDELAESLRIAKSSLYKLAQEGRIPGQKVGRQWRFRKPAIDAWLDRNHGHALTEKPGK